MVCARWRGHCSKRSATHLEALAKLIGGFDFFQSLPVSTVLAICQVLRYNVTDKCDHDPPPPPL